VGIQALKERHCVMNSSPEITIAASLTVPVSSLKARTCAPVREDKPTVPEMHFLYDLIAGEVLDRRNLCQVIRQLSPEDRVVLHRVFERSAAARRAGK
jgi:hypothetical protein